MKLLRITALLAILPLVLAGAFLFGGIAFCLFMLAGFWEMAND